MNSEQIVAQQKVRKEPSAVEHSALLSGVSLAPRMLPAMAIEIDYKPHPVHVAYTRTEDDVLFQFLENKFEIPARRADLFALRKTFLAVGTVGEAIDFLSSTGNFRGGRRPFPAPDNNWSGEIGEWSGPPDSHWNRISWSEFVSWQEVVRMLMVNGGHIPWIEGEGLESGRFDLPENAQELVWGLDEEEFHWLEGHASGINIRADAKRKDSRGRTELYAEIRVCSTLEAMFATAYIDGLNGVNYALCALQDCDNLFEITSNHAREYCSQACAHKASVRRRRAEAKRLKEAAAKQATKSRAKKGRG